MLQILYFVFFFLYFVFCVHLNKGVADVVYMYDIPFKNMKDEESVVRKLANGLHTVFKDNPNFLEWIAQNSNKKDD